MASMSIFELGRLYARDSVAVLKKINLQHALQIVLDLSIVVSPPSSIFRAIPQITSI